MVLLNFAVCNKRVSYQTDIRFKLYSTSNSSFIVSLYVEANRHVTYGQWIGTRRAANFGKRSNRIDKSTTLVRLIDVTG